MEEQWPLAGNQSENTKGHRCAPSIFWVVSEEGRDHTHKFFKAQELLLLDFLDSLPRASLCSVIAAISFFRAVVDSQKRAVLTVISLNMLP